MLRNRGLYSMFFALMLLLATCPAWTTTMTAFADATPVAPDAPPVPLAAPILAEWTIANPLSPYIAFDSVWVLGHHDHTTSRIDPTTNDLAVIDGTGDHAEQALAVGDVLWVTGQANDTTWLDPETNTVTTTMASVPGYHHSIAYGFGSLWSTASSYNVDRIDPLTGAIITSIPYDGGFADCNSSVYASAAAVWVEYCDGQEWVKIDPATNRVVSETPYTTLVERANAQTTAPTGNPTEDFWVGVGYDSTFGLVRIDPADGTGLTFIPLGQDQLFGSFTVTEDAIWLGGRNGLLYRVNLSTNLVDGTYDTGRDDQPLWGDIYYTAVGFGSVWVVKYDLNLVQRLAIAP